MAPVALVVARPNGSGKTTIAREYLKTHKATYVSADEIAASLGGDLQDVRLAAGREFFSRIKKLAASGEPLLIESTLSGLTMKDVLEDLRERGYSTSILFIYLASPQVCLKRIEERVRLGGHDVPAEDVRRRFHRSISNFWSTYRFLSDRWYLAHNSGATWEEVAQGVRDSVSVVNESLYDGFLYLIEGEQE